MMFVALYQLLTFNFSLQASLVGPHKADSEIALEDKVSSMGEVIGFLNDAVQKAKSGQRILQIDA